MLFPALDIEEGHIGVTRLHMPQLKAALCINHCQLVTLLRATGKLTGLICNYLSHTFTAYCSMSALLTVPVAHGTLARYML